MRPIHRRALRRTALVAACLSAFSLFGCSLTPTRPERWTAPEVLVPPSSFSGVHGLAVDAQGRLLAGSVVGNAIWQVDRQTGAAQVLVAGPEGQADDIAIGPKGEMAWTNYLTGMVRYREHDQAPMKVLAKDLPGINSLAFDPRTGKLYASQVFLGDAVWEIDVAGRKPPRLIAKDLGGFNGFEVGPDGRLYGPLWFRHSVAALDPATGELEVLESTFHTPAAANLDGKGNVYVIDTATGELARVSIRTGTKTRVAQLDSALDNLAVAPDGTVYVSNMADNGIQAVNPTTGEVRTLTRGAVAVPAGLAVDGDRLWVADIFAMRQVDLTSGKVSDVRRMHATGNDMEYPFSVGVNATRIALASWFTGTVQLIDKASGKTQVMAHGFKAPYAAQPMADGSVLVLEIATGSLMRCSGDHLQQRDVVASGLAGPVQLALAADGLSVFVTEAAGSVTQVRLKDGQKQRLAEGLALPEGIAITPWGSLLVAEAGAARLTEMDLSGQNRRTVASGLPIGLSGGPGMPPPYVPTGLALGADGSVYLSADRNNAIYRIRPHR